jgi:hypothetical protein
MSKHVAKVVIVSSVLTAAILGVLYLLGFFTVEDSEDDRPPVVVSSGSVLIESMADMVNEYGTATRVDPKSARNWYFHHSKRSPKVFTLVIDGSTDQTIAGCRSSDVTPKVQQVEFAYAYTNSPSFSVSVQKGAMQFDFVTDINKTTDTELFLTDAGGLLSVRYRRNPGHAWTTCRLDTNSRVTIHQRQK